MGRLTEIYENDYRDNNTNGVAESGLYDPPKSALRRHGAEIEEAIALVGAAGLADHSFATKAEADTAAAGYADDIKVLVFADPDQAKNDIWIVASGALVLTGTNGIVHDVIAVLAQPHVDAANGYADDAAASAAAFAAQIGLLETVSICGRTVDPVTGSSISTGNKFILIDPFASDDTVASGFVSALKFYSTATGTLTLEQWRPDGTTYNFVATATVTVTATGAQNFVSGLGTLNDIRQGDVFAVKVGTAGVATYTVNTSDGTGYAVVSLGATTAANPSLTTTNRLEFSVEITQRTVSSDAIFALRQAIDDINSDVFEDVTGRQVTPTAGTSGIAAGTFIVNRTLPYAETIKQVQVYGGSAGGVINVSHWSLSGSTMTRKGYAALTVTANVLNTFDLVALGLDFDAAAGEYLGFDVPANAVKYTGSVTADHAGWYSTVTRNPASFTIGVPNTSVRLEVQFIGEYTVSGASTDDFKQRLMAGSVLPVSLIADGNSLTAGSQPPYASLFNPWSGYLGSSLGVAIPNYGVMGQTTQQMIADAASQIDPVIAAAIAAGFKPVVLAQELYNDIRVNNLTPAQAVDNMATYCAARRAAGAKVGVFNLSDMGAAGYFVDGMVDAVNAEMAARWFTFADFLIDLTAYPPYSDKTDTTYFLSDQIHWNPTLQQFTEKVVRRAMLAGF